MKSRIIFIVFLLIFIPVTVFSQGYLGKSSHSVFNISKEIYYLYEPDGSITEEARSRILQELARLYGSGGIPLDTAEVKNLIEKNNLPMVNILNSKRFSDYANLYNFKSSRGSFITSSINILVDILMGKVSSAAKYSLFTLFMNGIFAEKEMRILFSNTADYFNTFSINNIKASPRLFTETFKSDLKEIPYNIPKIFVAIKKYRDTLDQHPHLKLYLEANRYYRELKNLKPVYEINNKTLTNLNAPNNQHSELYNSLKLLQYVYFQFKNESSQQSFYRTGFLESIKELKNNNVLQDLYLGLVCAQNPDIEFAMKQNDNIKESGGQKGESIQLVQMTPMINLLRKNESHNKIINYFYNYAELYDEITNLSDTIYALKEYGDPVPEEMKDMYFDKSVEFLQYALDPSNIYPEGNFDKSEITLFIDILKKYKKLENNIGTGQNLAALMNTFYIYGDLCKTHSAFGVIYQGFSGNFLKGISVVADILSAKNDEDVAKIVSDYVFSNTDANAKKESDFSFLLNSYGGIYYGKQFDNVRNNWSRNRGAFAPIGLEISKGFKNFGNLSLFVPFFDVGAIIDFKVSNDSVETVTKLEMDNIISPGLYLAYGFPKIPISIGGGFQFSPHLSKVTLNGNVIEPRKLRWNVFLAFDLPLLRIF